MLIGCKNCLVCLGGEGLGGDGFRRLYFIKYHIALMPAEGFKLFVQSDEKSYKLNASMHLPMSVCLMSNVFIICLFVISGWSVGSVWQLV